MHSSSHFTCESKQDLYFKKKKSVFLAMNVKDILFLLLSPR